MKFGAEQREDEPPLGTVPEIELPFHGSLEGDYYLSVSEVQTPPKSLLPATSEPEQPIGEPDFAEAEIELAAARPDADPPGDVQQIG